MDMPLALLNRRRRGSVLNPAILFSVAGSRGFFYDFSDYNTQFTDTAGTAPVTGVGQSVGLVLDESRGSTVFGSNIVVNGTLDVDASWTKGASVTISGGVANLPLGSGYLEQMVATEAGRAYRVTATAGAQPVFCGAWDTAGQAGVLNLLSGGVSSGGRSGTFSFVFVAADTTSFIAFTATGSGATTLDNVSVTPLPPGNHATQATAGSRPLTTTIGTGFRGIQFDGVDDFLKTEAIDFAGAESLGPELVTNGGFAVGTGWTLNTGWTIGSGVLSGNVGAAVFASASAPVTLVPGRVYRITFSITAYTSGAVRPNFFGGIDVFGSTDRAAVGTFTETLIATTGNNVVAIQARAAGFVGTIDNISVREVVIPADKMTVVAGVRKLSDAARAMLVELGPPAATGTFRLEAPNAASPNYFFLSTGTASAGAGPVVTYAAPISNVVSGLSDVSGDLATLRVNGTQVAQSTADQGTGNYANDIVYIGRRGGTTLPFNGILTFLCVINRTLTAAELAQLEAFANSRTGAY